MLYVRAVILSTYFDVSRLLGLDAFHLLKEVGLSPSWLEDPEFRIPAKPVATLLELSAQRSGCASFGLLMAEYRSFQSLGPLALLLERLTTVRDLLDAIITYRRHLSDVLDIEVEESGDTTTIRLDYVREYDGPQTADLALGVGYRVLRGATAGKWLASAVHLARKAPDDPRPWQRYFHVPIEFECGFDGLSCPNESLSTKLPLADPTMALHASRLLDLMPIHPEHASVSDHVTRLIARLLPTGGATAEQVARIMGVSLRGLQRSLEQEGHTFASLQNTVRKEMALRCLTNSSQSITVISDLMGYSAPSSFTRWFAAEFGVSPQAWRSTRRSSAHH